MQAVLVGLLVVGAQEVVLPALSRTRNCTVYVPVGRQWIRTCRITTVWGSHPDAPRVMLPGP